VSGMYVLYRLVWYPGQKHAFSKAHFVISFIKRYLNYNETHPSCGNEISTIQSMIIGTKIQVIILQTCALFDQSLSPKSLFSISSKGC
jgi:hypothetical protein